MVNMYVVYAPRIAVAQCYVGMGWKTVVHEYVLHLFNMKYFGRLPVEFCVEVTPASEVPARSPKPPPKGNRKRITMILETRQRTTCRMLLSQF